MLSTFKATEGTGNRVSTYTLGIFPSLRQVGPSGSGVDIGISPDNGKAFLECLDVLEMPWRIGIGNHEIHNNKPDPKSMYKSLFGPTYYSFDFADVHFIILDGNKPHKSRGAARGTIENEELAWLKADLAAQPSGKAIIPAVHIPIVTTYVDRRFDLTETQGPFWQSKNAAKITKLFTQYNVPMVLQAHSHENERIMLDKTEYVSSISVSGSWWHANEGFERGYDGTPRGYRIVSVDGSEVSHRYSSSCESKVERQVEFMNLPNTLAANNTLRLKFTAYDAPNHAQALLSIDQQQWHDMTPTMLGNSSVRQPHHWHCTLDCSKLSPGEHTIACKVTAGDCYSIMHKESFTVQNDG